MGDNNTFISMDIPTNITVSDQSGSSQFIHTWADNVGTIYGGPTSEESAAGNDNDSTVWAKGSWRFSTSPETIATTKLTNGQAWRALLIGNFGYYGRVQSAVPPVVEVTDAANTVSVGGHTLTFAISGNKFTW